MEQDAVYGNEFERHRSPWTVQMLRQIGFDLLESGERDRFGNQKVARGPHGAASSWLNKPTPIHQAVRAVAGESVAD
jgi:hypothetical protein